MPWDTARITRALRVMHDRYSFTVAGELRMLVIDALWAYVDSRDHPDRFTVDEWDDKGRTRVVAVTDDHGIGQAAFDAAVERWPDAKLTFRKGAWVMREWPAREG